jgi:glycosyltransferase involved in cell wall biosynthesis
MFKPGPCPPDSKDRPYLLHVGQQYPHKNLRRLIQAFAQMAERYPELRLVLAGKSHPTETPVLQAMVRQRGLQQCVDFYNYVPYAALPDLYRGALALVYPSLWEGFGLPILEAMACGTPVITSRGSGTEEVAGDAAVLVNPTNLMALVEALQGLLDQSHQRSLLRQRGLERALEFGWSQVAATTHSVVSQQLGSPAGLF